jgi:putative ABC transport system permease protein
MQRLIESVAVALEAIWASKLRSLMTVLGNVVAVTSIIAVVALIQGLNASVKQAILDQAGADSFAIQQFPVTRTDEDAERSRSNPRVTEGEAQAVRRSSPLVQSVILDSTARGRVRYRDRSIDNVRIRGVTSDYTNFSSFDAERGRLMSPVEVARSQPVAVVGWQVADRLFGPTADPVGRVILVEGVHFRVVGASAKRGTLLGQSQDEFVVVPLGQLQTLFGPRQPLSMMVRPRDVLDIGRAMDEATVALRAARRLRPTQRDNFGLFTSDTILDIYYSATRGIFAVLVGVVSLSLVVGGIVIMNIMLMVVTERTREIGLRRALGATRRDIMAQVLTESVVLSVCGGAVGTALGSLIAAAIGWFTPVQAAIELWSVVVGIGVTAIVGLFFGLYPARRAAALDPIDALRRE